MNALYILYDPYCGFCVQCQRWLAQQPSYLPLRMVARGTDAEHALFPGLRDHYPQDELLVLSDEGGIYVGSQAWIICLYALKEWRELSLRLATPALLPFARRVFELVSKNRYHLTFWLDAAPETLQRILQKNPATPEGRAA